MTEDNIEGKSSQELEDVINQNALEEKPEIDKVEETKVEEEVVKKEVEETKVEEAPVEVEKDKFNGKDKDAIIEMYKNLEKDHTRKSQELAESKKEEPVAPVSTTETTPAVDPLYEMLFGNQQTDKVETPQVKAEETYEPDRVDLLEAKLDKGAKQLQYMQLQQLQQTERKAAIGKFEKDSVLPFNAEVEQELEATVFKQLPQLKYQKGGYEYAYKLLKADKTDALVSAARESAVAEALEKRGKNDIAVVETPVISDPEPEIDLTKLNSTELEAHIRGLESAE